MPSRFTHTDKWKVKWFGELKPASKLLFLYALDQMDLAGFWEEDERRACFDIGLNSEQYLGAKEGLLRGCLGAIIEKSGWWWYSDFIKEQRNWPLNPQNNAHKSIIIRLNDMDKVFNTKKKLGANKGLSSPTSNSKSKGINIPFDEFWNLYDKKNGDRAKVEKKWNNLTDDDRLKIIAYIPQYKLSTPDKKFRKHPETFLNNKSWNDEIINPITPPTQTPLF